VVQLRTLALFWKLTHKVRRNKIDKDGKNVRTKVIAKLKQHPNRVLTCSKIDLEPICKAIWPVDKWKQNCIFFFLIAKQQRRNVLLRIFLSWPIGIRHLTQFGRTKKRERGRERDMRSGAFLPVLPRKTKFEVHKCEGVLIDINFLIVIIYTQLLLASKKQSKRHKTHVMKHTIFFIMFCAIGTHLFMLPKQIHFKAKCVWFWLSHNLFFLHLFTTSGKACECWFFFSHQYHVNLLVFWRVSWMNDMPWTISLMGSSRETNASFDHNFLFHPLDLKLDIVMQKHDVKNQNLYWRALQVETL
jgi:hypothetical protein